MRQRRRHNSIVLTVAGFSALLLMIITMTVRESRTPPEECSLISESYDPSARPKETATPSISLPSESEVIIREDEISPFEKYADGVYENRAQQNVQTGFGRYLNIGLDRSDIQDALYINPHFIYQYAGNPYEQYGYLLRTDRVPLEYAVTKTAAGSDPQNAGYTDLAILGRTFDKVVPAVTENSELYGVRWRDNPACGGKEHDGDILYILIVRLSDGMLMGAARADIKYEQETNSYHIENFRNSDVQYTGDISYEWREELFNRAVNFLQAGSDSFSLGFIRPDWGEARNFVVIEKIPRVYFNKFFSPTSKIIPAGQFKNCDIYAVNINFTGYGYFTVYFAPEGMAYGLHTEQLGDEFDLLIIGYDAFAPMTVESFNSHLFPDDAETFGAAYY